jgi:hypothetical protein
MKPAGSRQVAHKTDARLHLPADEQSGHRISITVGEERSDGASYAAKLR